MLELNFQELSKINCIRICDLCACFSGATFIWLMLFYAKRKFKSDINYSGLIMISFAYILWGSMDLIRILSVLSAGAFNLVTNTFSAYNNAFFLASLPFFEPNVKLFKNRIPIYKKPSVWALNILLFNVLIVIFYSLTWGEVSTSKAIIRNFDVAYSAITFLLLGIVMTNSFVVNKQHYFAIMSVLLTLTLILTQLAFSTIFAIQHYDIISVTSLASHSILLILLIIMAKNRFEFQNELIYTDNVEKLKNLETELKSKIRILDDENAELKVIITSMNEDIKSLQTEKSSHMSIINLKSLSDREIEILRNINKSYFEIGELLFITRDTVISHKKNIETKLGISGKESLLRVAIDNGLIPAENISFK
ncbi:MAG: hypothetical protein IPO27_19080 [Bacteroidetes bacterium]|nr:hypothetical protein [Bacteroidota bacterium]